MKKFLRLTCTNCRRDIDKLVNVTHYTPDRCTITQGCEGRLQPVEYRSSAGIAVSPEVGVTDWQPRGSKKIVGKAIIQSDLINLITGSTKQIVVASPQDLNTLTVRFDGKADAPKTYRSYVFRKEGAFSTISGVESGLEKKALRFTGYGDNPDMVEVYLNGVKKEPNQDYTIADGSNSVSAPPNTIAFNELIDVPGITQIDVIVSKDVPAMSYDLVFKRNRSDESRAGTGAYENVNSVEVMKVDWETNYLYTLDLDSANLPLNTILVPKDNQDAMFLLARRPYTQLDRDTSIVVPLAAMDLQVEYLKYFLFNDEPRLSVTVESLLTIFPPLRLNKFNVEKPIMVPTAGVEEQLVVDGKVITGPDA